MIENRWLVHALALGQHRNFARAAQALNLTQPALSRSIAALERSLGVTLFDRSHKGVQPTAFGRTLLGRAEVVLKHEAGLRRDIALLAGLDEGTLAVGAGPYFAESVVASAVARMVRAHPRLRIRCVSLDLAEVVRDVLAERLDLGIAAIPGIERDARLEVEFLPAQQVYLACRRGHPLTRESAPTLDRVFSFPLVTTLLRGAHAKFVSAHRPARESVSREGDYTPPIFVNTIALARKIARESDAVVPGMAATLADDVAAGRLVPFAFDVPGLQATGAVFHLRGRTLAPAATEFLRTLRVVAEEEARTAETLFAAAVRPSAKPRRRTRSAG